MSDEAKARAFMDAQEWIFAKTWRITLISFFLFLCVFCG